MDQMTTGGILGAGEAHGTLGGLLRGVAPYRQDPLPGMEAYAGAARDQYEVRFREIFEEAMALYRRKTKDYGASWTHHGADGVFVRLADKFARLDTLYWRREAPQVEDESLRDTLRDMIPYVLMMIDRLERGDLRG